jgi:hypothetical protein
MSVESLSWVVAVQSVFILTTLYLSMSVGRLRLRETKQRDYWEEKIQGIVTKHDQELAALRSDIRDLRRKHPAHLERVEPDGTVLTINSR